MYKCINNITSHTRASGPHTGSVGRTARPFHKQTNLFYITNCHNVETTSFAQMCALKSLFALYFQLQSATVMN